MMRAEEGHVLSMIAMGDLYYWGGRGLERDHVRARGYFERAANLGNINAMSLAAGMFIKGEGGAKNVTRAVELYEAAAKEGDIR